MKRIALMSVAVVSVLALAGCKPEEEIGTIGEENSQVAGKSLQASIEKGASDFQVEQAAFGGACYAFSGNTADFDGDQIPVEIILTYNGCTGSDSRGVVSLNGTRSIRDDDPAVAAYLFTADANLTVDIIAANGGTLGVTYQGLAKGSQPGSEYQLDVEASGTIDAQLGAQSYSFAESIDWTAHYAPSSPWTPGLPAVAGTYSVEGNWSASVDSTAGSGSADAMITTTSPLVIDPSCGTKVVGGSIQASYAGTDENRALSVTWTGCGQGTVSYSESPST